ncbi:MAG: ABC transporter permease [Actinomycetes bacterium]|jgi:putative spermidine/putrescine transport system permease protein
MNLSKSARWGLTAITGIVLVFIYFPLLVVLVNSFNASKVFSWPPTSWTMDWWSKAATNDGVRSALLTSVKAGVGATLIAIVLGSMVAFAVARYDFFGRDSISFLVILPIALPGIITGIALNASFNTVLVPLGISFGLFTVILGHATFCIVVVFNNVVARLRRTGSSLEEAAMDLGAGPFQTFRDVTFPAVRSALVAGALLAFALSFDEIVVTSFTSGPGVETLPQWIFNNLFRPNQGPIINAVAAALLLAFIAPVYLAMRMSDGPGRVVQVGAEP